MLKLFIYCPLNSCYTDNRARRGVKGNKCYWPAWAIYGGLTGDGGIFLSGHWGYWPGKIFPSWIMAGVIGRGWLARGLLPMGYWSDTLFDCGRGCFLAIEIFSVAMCWFQTHVNARLQRGDVICLTGRHGYRTTSALFREAVRNGAIILGRRQDLDDSEEGWSTVRKEDT